MSDNKKYLNDSFDEDSFDDEFIIDDPLMTKEEGESETEKELTDVDFFSVPEIDLDSDEIHGDPNAKEIKDEEFVFEPAIKVKKEKVNLLQSIRKKLEEIKEKSKNRSENKDKDILGFLKKSAKNLATGLILLLIIYAFVFYVIKPLIGNDELEISKPDEKATEVKNNEKDVNDDEEEGTQATTENVEKSINPLHPIMLFTEEVFNELVKGNAKSYNANQNYSLNNIDKSKYRNELKSAIEEREKYINVLIKEEMNFYTSENEKLFDTLYAYAKFTQERDTITLKQLSENENRVRVIERVNGSHEEEANLALEIMNTLVETLENNNVKYKVLQELRIPDYFIQLNKINYSIDKYID